MTGKMDTVYTVNYGIIDKNVPIASSAGGSSVYHLIDGDPKTSWSASGTPWVRFYLGDRPTIINSVSLGYSRDTQIRRSYYFDFEVSNDGFTWTKVMADNWRKDNLGNGHIMGMEVMPGAGGDSASDYETFTFPQGISARLLRVTMFGARSGTGTGSANANKYWAIDVDTAVSKEPLKKLIAEAKAITNEDAQYTANSYSALLAAIEVAQSALESIETEQELDNAINALKTSIDGLVIVEPDPSLVNLTTADLEKMIKENDLSVSFDGEKGELRLPITAASMIGGHKLNVTLGKTTWSIESTTLLEVAALLNKQGITDGTISIKVDRLSDDTDGSLLESRDNKNGLIKKVSDIFQLTLNGISPDGSTVSVNQIKKPIQVSINLGPKASGNIVGIYDLGISGEEWNTAKGKKNNNQATVEWLPGHYYAVAINKK